jgi:hypothetical protein
MKAYNIYTSNRESISVDLSVMSDDGRDYQGLLTIYLSRCYRKSGMTWDVSFVRYKDGTEHRHEPTLKIEFFEQLWVAAMFEPERLLQYYTEVTK